MTNTRDPLGLEIMVTVSDDELDTIDQDLRPEFVSGMACPVPGCGDTTFTSFCGVLKHWKKYHRSMTRLYQCGFQKGTNQCTYRTPIRSLVVKHKEKHSGEVVFTSELVENKNYRHPGECKCPKRGSSLNVTGRELAQQERLRITPVTSNLQPTTYNCRDETIIYSRERDTPRVVVKQRWMKISK